MPSLPFLGLRGSEDFVADARPKHWREGILRLYPNGKAPLTALTSFLTSEKVDDPEFNWWIKGLPTQSGAIAGVFTASAMEGGDAYGSGGEAGDTVYVKLTADKARECKAGHVVVLRASNIPQMTCVGHVRNVTVAGANSYLTVVLIEDDVNGGIIGDLSDADFFEIIGSAYEEGAPRPGAVAYDPKKVSNLTQIFRNSLDQTRTARKTRLRTGDQYKEAKRECLELHSIEMEKAWLWGVPYEDVGEVEGKPRRFTGGLLHFIKTHAPENVAGFLQENPTAKWEDYGKFWLDTKLEQIFRYGDDEKLMLCGSGAVLAINRLAEAIGTYNISATTTSFGMNVWQFITPFGKINLKTHPLFSYVPQNRNMGVILEPKRLKYRYIDDTFFKGDDRERKGGGTGADKLSEEFLTEAGLEFHHPNTCGIFYQLGESAPDEG